MEPKVPSEEIISGTGVLHRGRRRMGTVGYTMHIDPAHGQAFMVRFDPKPRGRDGDLVHLTIEDGRVLNCKILDSSAYCAVVGHGPIFEHRRRVRGS